VNRETIDFLFVGVGGQGIILASDIVAELGVSAGYDVKKSEIHGMSQRGGSVESFVRWGRNVASPIAERGRVDFLISFELLETARWTDFLAPDGVVILNRQHIAPLAVAGGEMDYPEEQAVLDLFSATVKIHVVDGLEAAKALGNANTVNVVLLGVLSRSMEVPVEKWKSVIAERVPQRFRELNQRAFLAGRSLWSEGAERVK
jgi:indolepyruvate ferredoxin oxidoreductase beta subunit